MLDWKSRAVWQPVLYKNSWSQPCSGRTIIHISESSGPQLADLQTVSILSPKINGPED